MSDTIPPGAGRPASPRTSPSGSRDSSPNPPPSGGSSGSAGAASTSGGKTTSKLVSKVLASTLFPEKQRNIQVIDTPDENQELWKLYTKAKDALPNGKRMENLTWRLMALSLHKDEIDEAQRTAAAADKQAQGPQPVMPARRASFGSAMSTLAPTPAESTAHSPISPERNSSNNFNRSRSAENLTISDPLPPAPVSQYGQDAQDDMDVDPTSAITITSTYSSASAANALSAQLQSQQ
ncbi:hypothetical protein BCR44DRAFT_59123, partial [Catenaria anguillulae PL171]